MRTGAFIFGVVFLIPGLLGLLVYAGVFAEILAVPVLILPAVVVLVAGAPESIVATGGHIPGLTLLGVFVVYIVPAALFFLATILLKPSTTGRGKPGADGTPQQAEALGVRISRRLGTLITVGIPVLLVMCVAWGLVANRAERAFAEKSAFYQSGVRQALLDRDVTQAGTILEENPSLISQRDYYGRDALMLAAKAGDREMVNMLLARRADPNTSDYTGATPLHLAARSGDVETARMLLDKGARTNQEDGRGKTPLVYARASGSGTMIDFLLSRGGTDVNYDRLLVKAVQDGNIQEVENLLDRGLSVSTAVPNGHCLLDYAAEKGNVAMARFLISRGASPRRADKYGRTALYWGSGEGNADMVIFLIDQGADVNVKEWEGETPLHNAVYWSQWHKARSLDTIKALVEKGADLNAKDNRGTTVLKHAQKFGTDSITAYLRSRGASE